MLDHDWYNNLLTVQEADKAFTDRPQWFSRIAPLLGREEFRGRYSLSLVHRHVILQPGEAMVATGPVTRPETLIDPDDPNIIPSSWTATGIPFEWKRVETPTGIIPPPTQELIREFSKIVGEDSVLGLSLVQDPVPDGKIWCERIDHGQRHHILEIKPVGSWPEGAEVFETCWTLKSSSGRAEPSIVFSLHCVCWVCKVHGQN
ncbi:hypothetical protein EST38_g13950 [Candolleomyces aberdarensis]|uniref:Uncharacterized protein n=1 Tax=Candolleomyces aberdarensis TaxID=2316362 RepID=A0A4Q2D1B4_9AGAR|nr:hypothetical protein EST38_g13950 [Candolleomyces aberdarensis]